jgi:hypothetical protein
MTSASGPTGVNVFVEACQRWVIRDRVETTADQAISGIPPLLPDLAMQPKIVMGQKLTLVTLAATTGSLAQSPAFLHGKKISTARAA